MLNLRQIDFRLCCCEVALEQDLNLVPIFALSKLGVVANFAMFLSISLTNAARALGSGYSQASPASGFFAEQKIRFKMYDTIFKNLSVQNILHLSLHSVCCGPLHFMYKEKIVVETVKILIPPLFHFLRALRALQRSPSKLGA